MKKSRRTRRIFDPQEKITAVLSIWTECRTQTQVCQEMSVSWAMLDRWQNQAMEGMLTALTPSRSESKATLNTRLSRLVEKKGYRADGEAAKAPEKDSKREKIKDPIKGTAIHEEIRPGKITRRDNYEGKLRSDDSYPGSSKSENIPQNILQMGEKRIKSSAGKRDGSSRRTAGEQTKPQGEEPCKATGAKSAGGRVASQENTPEGNNLRTQPKTRHRPVKKKIKSLRKRSRRSRR